MEFQDPQSVPRQGGKKSLSEADICAKYITPAIEDAGWDDSTQLRREVHFTKGQIHVRGKMVTRGMNWAHRRPRENGLLAVRGGWIPVAVRIRVDRR